MSNAALDNLAGDAVIQLVTFRLKDESYGINVMQVQEILTGTGRDKDWQLAGRRG